MNAVVSLILWKMCTENYVLHTYLPSTGNKEQQLKHKKKTNYSAIFCDTNLMYIFLNLLDKSRLFILPL